MKIPVFRKGEWIEYDDSCERPSGWQPSHSYQAASIFATAHSLGYSPNESASFAEMYIFKQLFEGIVYDRKLEVDLDRILNHGETA